MLRRTFGFISTLVLLAGSLFPATSVAAQPPVEVEERRTATSRTLSLGDNRYALDVSIGPIHYRNNPSDTSEPWKPIDNTLRVSAPPWNWVMDGDGYTTRFVDDFKAGQVLRFESQGEYVSFQPMALEWTNDIAQIQTVAMPQSVTPVVNNEPVELLPGMSGNVGSVTWPNGYGLGRDFTWLNQPGRLAKLLVLDALPPAPESYIIEGGNPTLRLNFIFAPSSALDIIVDGELWDKKAKRQTVNTIEFRNAAGETLWGFMPATYWDSVGDVQSGTTELSKSGSKLYVSVLVSYSWLSTATYPIYVDPTLDLQVGLNADDGYWSEPNTAFSNAGTTRYAGNGFYAAGPSNWFDRFTGLSGVNGDTVDVMYISIKGGTMTGGQVDLVVSMVAADNAPAPTTYNEAENAARTVASVGWTVTAWADGTWYNSPSLVSIGQEAAVNGYFATGPAVIYTEDNGSAAANYLRGYQHDLGAANAATLHIEYTEGVVVPTVTTQAASDIEATTATGNGNITATGGENADERGFDWDIDTGAPYANSATDLGSFGVGAFTKSLTGLPTGTTIYYRAKAHNSAGWGYGAETTFLTLTVIGAPTNFTATVNDLGNIDLSWTTGAGATNTEVRGSTSGYPTTTAEGDLVYFGALEVYEFTPASGYDIYYFSAWGENGAGLYSGDYATASAGGEGMVLLVLALIAVGLTVAMFGAKNMMLGFPSAMFWAILGGYAYTQSTTPWGDWQFYLFFASAFGMVVFTAISAYALRPRDIDPDAANDWLGSGKYIEDTDQKGGSEEDEEGKEDRERQERRARRRRRNVYFD